MKKAYWLLFYSSGWNVEDGSFDYRPAAEQRAAEMINRGEASTVCVCEELSKATRSVVWSGSTSSL